MSQFIDIAQVLTGQRRKRLGFRLLLTPSLCGFVLLRLERLLPPRREALLRLVKHLKHRHSLRFSPLSGHLLPRAIINSFWSRGEEFQFLAKWSVSSPMALGETPTLADAKADIYQY